MKLPNDIVAKYKDGKKMYSFPDSQTTPPVNKDRDYLLRVAQSIFQRFIRNRTGIYYSMYPIWEDNRLYGAEQQYTTTYRRTFSPGDWSENNQRATSTELDPLETQFDLLNKKRRGEITLDYSIISLAKRVKNTVHGMFDQVDWDISIDVVDPVHKYEEKYQQYKLYNEVIFKDFFNKWRASANIPQSEHRFLPKSEEELNAYSANGGFKLNTAISLEKLLKHTFNISNWDDIKYKFIDDSMELGVVATKEYYDHEEECIKSRYSDPSACGTQFAQQNDMDEPDYAFEIVMYPISKLIQQGYDKEELFNVAKRYQGAFGNPIKGEWGRYDFYTIDTDEFAYFQVPVMEFEIIDTDCEYQTVWTDSHNQRRVKTGEFGKEINGENKKTRIMKTRRKYEGKWILDTDLMFDDGPSRQQYKINKKPRLSWKFVRITDKPVIEQLKPVFDDMMHAWVRYQKAAILAGNSGYAINARLLTNIQMGEEDWSIEQILDFMRETGYLLYSDTDEDGQYGGGEVRPVHEIPGGMKQILEDSIQRFQMAVNTVETITGINLVAMGASPHPDAGKDVTEMSIKMTSNAIKPYIEGVRKLKRKTAEGLSEKIRLFIRSAPEIATNTYSKVVGLNDLYALKIADDTAAEYGLSFEARATDQDKADILRAAEIALAPGKDGTSMIKYPDWLNLKMMISSGSNLKLMNQIMAYQVEKYETINEQKAREAQEIERQKNIEYEQAQAESSARELQMKTQADMALEDRKSNNKLKEIYAQGEIDEKIKRMEIEADKYDENLNAIQQQKGGQ
jgi:hypothetical protein